MSISGQFSPRQHCYGSPFGRSVSVLKIVACASLYQWALLGEQPKPTIWMGCRGGARVPTIVHWWTRAARVFVEIGRRWPRWSARWIGGRVEELNRARSRAPNARCLLEKAERRAKVSHHRWYGKDQFQLSTVYSSYRFSFWGLR